MDGGRGRGGVVISHKKGERYHCMDGDILHTVMGGIKLREMFLDGWGALLFILRHAFVVWCCVVQG